MRAHDELVTLTGRYEVGATGAHTIVAGGKGITGVARTATGKYKMTLTAHGQPFGPIVHASATHWPQADAEPLVLAPSDGGYSASARSILFEAWVIDETAAQTEVPSGDQVSYTVTFLKTA
jgi:hypothetical protein